MLAGYILQSRLWIPFLLGLLILKGSCVLSQDLAKQSGNHEYLPAKGPSKGKLLLMGGGILDVHAELIRRFAGGEGARIVVIPTAFSDEEIAKDPEFRRVRKRFEKLEFSTIHILHTRDPEIANQPTFTKPLEEAMAVIILGGKTQRITDAYAGTRTYAALKALLDREGMIAGVSAGSGVQASYFYEDKLVEGFEFLEGVIVMNHFLARNKQFAHTEAIHRNRERLALGIDEGVGVLVQGERFEVVGNSYVAVYDGSMYHRENDSISSLPHGSEQFYLLKNGDRYNLRERRVESNASLTPLKLSPPQLATYEGTYTTLKNDFRISLQVERDTLFLTNSWEWTPYPIFPFRDDLFYATNRNMWFQFIRDEKTGAIIRLQKMNSFLQQRIFSELEKVD
ncbi:MAG: cyanophycinase [Bacteroidota bacterium]